MKSSVSSASQEVVVYLARMEEALCRLLSDDAQQVRLAVNLYRGITKDFDRYPNCWFRLGQALAQAAADEQIVSPEALEIAKEAFNAYETTAERIKDIAGLTKDERYLLISPGQDSYIRENLGRLQGFILWRMSDRRRLESGQPTETDLADVIGAFWITERAFEAAPEGSVRSKLANNATFYAVDAINLANELGRRPKNLPTLTNLKTVLNSLAGAISLADEVNVLQWDTVARARVLLGDMQGATEAATKVLDAGTAPAKRPGGLLSAYVIEGRRRAVQYAWSIVRPVANAENS